MIEEGQDPNDLEPDYTDSESEGTEFNLEKDEFAEMFSFDNDKRADKKFYRSGKNKHEKEIGTDTGNGKNIPTLLPRVGGLKYRMPLKMHYREYGPQSKHKLQFIGVSRSPKLPSASPKFKTPGAAARSLFP